MYGYQNEKAGWKDGEDARERSKVWVWIARQYRQLRYEYRKDETYFHIISSSAHVIAMKMSMTCKKKEELGQLRAVGLLR